MGPPGAEYRSFRGLIKEMWLPKDWRHGFVDLPADPGTADMSAAGVQDRLRRMAEELSGSQPLTPADADFVLPSHADGLSKYRFAGLPVDGCTTLATVHCGLAVTLPDEGMYVVFDYEWNAEKGRHRVEYTILPAEDYEYHPTTSSSGAHWS